MSTTAVIDIAQAFEFAGLTTHRSRWGHLRADLGGGRVVQVTEDDGTFHVLVFAGGKAELIESQVSVSGALASPVGLAALLEAVAA